MKIIVNKMSPLGCIVVVLVLASFSSAATPPYKLCASPKGTLVSLDVTPCVAGQPCKFPKGQNATIKVTFTPNEAVASGKAVVHGIIAGVPVPFPLPDADLCKFSTPACPFAASTTYTYSNQLFVAKEYPAISVVVKWELQDPSASDIVCVEFPIQIVS